MGSPLPIVWEHGETAISTFRTMTDFLETPVGDFEWGPGGKIRNRLHRMLPAIAIGAGLTIAIAGVLILVRG